ncbi:L,D-transpeptidase [Candidatus Amesbacteria bacterium]|nr:L,D-transpeptidase [Candidatus Amesbacteria bacterium]
MRLGTSLLLIASGIVLSVVVLQLSFSTYTQSKIPQGCPALSDSGDFDLSQTVAFWDNQLVDPPSYLYASLTDTDLRVLGQSTGGKWIEIDLSDQKMTAHNGDSVFLESPISSGLWNKTPVGEYRIWYKIRSTKMEGGIPGTKSYYYLPNVPYAMFFNGSYGIHGTYWHANFGTPMSHGCVNSPTPVAEKLFYWTDPQLPPGEKIVRATTDNPGTLVIVHE